MECAAMSSKESQIPNFWEFLSLFIQEYDDSVCGVTKEF